MSDFIIHIWSTDFVADRPIKITLASFNFAMIVLSQWFSDDRLIRKTKYSIAKLKFNTQT